MDFYKKSKSPDSTPIRKKTSNRKVFVNSSTRRNAENAAAGRDSDGMRLTSNRVQTTISPKSIPFNSKGKNKIPFNKLLKADGKNVAPRKPAQIKSRNENKSGRSKFQTSGGKKLMSRKPAQIKSRNNNESKYTKNGSRLRIQ